MANNFQTREDININDRWNLSDIFPDLNAWEEALKTLLSDYQEPVPGAKVRIEKTLRIMVTAWIAARTLQAAEKLIQEL